jgi:hypothetical protein
MRLTVQCTVLLLATSIAIVVSPLRGSLTATLYAIECAYVVKERGVCPPPPELQAHFTRARGIRRECHMTLVIEASIHKQQEHARRHARTAAPGPSLRAAAGYLCTCLRGGAAAAAASRLAGS